MASPFLRLINPGVVMNNDLKQKLETYTKLISDRDHLDEEIVELRREQDLIESELAEALAEEELQGTLRHERHLLPTEGDLRNIFYSHLGRTIEKISIKFERLLTLNEEVRKLKNTIERKIVAANGEALHS